MWLTTAFSSWKSRHLLGQVSTLHWMLSELLRYYSAVRDYPLLTSAQAPPFRPLPKSVSCPAKPPPFFAFPTSLLGSAPSCSRLYHSSSSCFQASTASWESFLSSFERALSLHSQGPGLRLRVLSSSLPLSLRLYYYVTSSLHFAIMSWRHYVTMAFLS